MLKSHLTLFFFKLYLAARKQSPLRIEHHVQESIPFSNMIESSTINKNYTEVMDTTKFSKYEAHPMEKRTERNAIQTGHYMVPKKNIYQNNVEMKEKLYPTVTYETIPPRPLEYENTYTSMLINNS